MSFSVRRLGPMVLPLLCWGLLSCPARAQDPYSGIPAFGAGVGAGFGSPAGSLISGLGSFGAMGGGVGCGPGGWGAGGYGGLYSGLGGYGGYGGIGGIYGAFNPFLYGVAANPYGGFLSGVASVTSANGQYEVYRQQAIKQRQENIRAVMENRIRQEEMENKIQQMRRGNAVEMRKQDEASALEQVRRVASQTDVFSGRALNLLLRNLITEQRNGHRGPKVALRDEDLQSVNLTPAGSRANMGLLRNIRARHKLAWPLSLQNFRFADLRDRIDRDLSRAVDDLTRGVDVVEVDPGTLTDLRANLALLRNQVQAATSANDLSMQESIEAKRFLGLVEETLRALENPNVFNFFNQKWIAKAHTAGELVRFMDENGLLFAAATPGDEAAYLALYNAMRQYDAGMDQEVASK